MSISVQELRKEKEKLSHEIAQMVQLKVDSFQKKTGMTPVRIDVNMKDVSNFSDPELTFQVASVLVGVDV